MGRTASVISFFLLIGTIFQNNAHALGFRTSSKFHRKAYIEYYSVPSKEALANYIGKFRSSYDPSLRNKLAGQIIKAAKCFGIDTYFFSSLVQFESAYKISAQNSGSKASGLTQMTGVGLTEVRHQLFIDGRANATRANSDYFQSRIYSCYGPGVLTRAKEIAKLSRKEAQNILRNESEMALIFGAVVVKVMAGKWRILTKKGMHDQLEKTYAGFNGEPGGRNLKHAKEVMKISRKQQAHFRENNLKLRLAKGKYETNYPVDGPVVLDFEYLLAEDENESHHITKTFTGKVNLNDQPKVKNEQADTDKDKDRLQEKVEKQSEENIVENETTKEGIDSKESTDNQSEEAADKKYFKYYEVNSPDGDLNMRLGRPNPKLQKKCGKAFKTGEHVFVVDIKDGWAEVRPTAHQMNERDIKEECFKDGFVTVYVSAKYLLQSKVK